LFSTEHHFVLWIGLAPRNEISRGKVLKKKTRKVVSRLADGRVLRLIRAMLEAGSYGKGQLFPSERGTPQGGVVSPLLSNILLTPFDREMRHKGYQLTRFADDWVVTCTSATEARAAIAAALRILSVLGVQLHPQKTRVVHVRRGFEFLGYLIRRGKQLKLPPGKIVTGARSGALYAYPREKSIQRFRDRVATALRMAANSLRESQSYLGAQFRRLRSRLGPPKTITAMAAKLARLVYRMLKYGQEYVDKGTAQYEEKYRQHKLKMITKQAAEHGLALVPMINSA
jgi:Reverse transcriptase (RNA-dependent DNA polymerase)